MGAAYEKTEEKIRLQKYLSDAGVASRRHAEEYILEGRVAINNEIVDQLPAFVDPQRDKVLVDGTVVKLDAPDYFLVHKPKGVVCTQRDPAGRPRAVDLLPPMKKKLFVVGRLDVESTGLLLMTNDGDLAQKIAHPRYGMEKVYRVEVKGGAPKDIKEQMQRGVHLSEGKATATDVEVKHRSRERTVLTVTLREGRNRQVRRMLAKLGCPVKSLKRVQIGPLSLKRLPVGASRRLTTGEIKAVHEAAAELEKRAGRSWRRRARAKTARPGKRGKKAARATSEHADEAKPRRRRIIE